jgi:acetyl esterase/lipase
MIEFPEAELEQARAFYRSWLLRRVRIDFQSRWQIRLVRMLAPLAHLAPSPLRKLGLAAETARVAANGRSVPVRIVRPKGPARGIVVDIHGGGWTILRAVQDDPLNGALAQAGFAVVSVDYRWAPEHPFQAVIDDAETALAWALAEGQRELGASDVLLHGDSAGAHLSLAAALRCRPSSPDFARLRGLVLWYGVFDLTATPSVRAAPPESLVLYAPTLPAFFARVTGAASEPARRDPAISPLYADLTGLPPALVIVGTADPLLDDSRLLADALRAARVDTELLVVPDAPHSFNRFPIALADRVNAHAREWMAARLRPLCASNPTASPPPESAAGE